MLSVDSEVFLMRRLLVFACAAAAAAAAGCTGKDVEVYRVAKSPAQPVMGNALPDGHPPLGAELMPQTAPPSGAARSLPPGGLRWKVPKGWSEEPGRGMRRATFKLGSGPSALETSVIVLGPGAGGHLGNVNRWRRQVGLGVIDAPTLKKESETVKSAAGPVFLADIRGPESAILAGMLPAGDEIWFFKLWGPKSAVGEAKPSFKKLLASLRPGA